MNDQISSTLKELRAERAKIEAMIDKVHESRFSSLRKDLNEVARTSNTPLASNLGYSTRSDVALHLKVSVRTVDNLMSRNEIPYFKIGGIVRFRLDEIDRALQQKYRIESRYDHVW